jgi:hypothetical protein
LSARRGHARSAHPIKPLTMALPMEHAVELNRLIQLELVGSIG